MQNVFGIFLERHKVKKLQSDNTELISHKKKLKKKTLSSLRLSFVNIFLFNFFLSSCFTAC